jgi:hypothetical protein
VNQRWTLQFENLGRIDKGEVRIAPMMIFTGDNNAGKSYVMALLWGVIALGRDVLFQNDPPESESYKLCDQWLLSHMGQDTALDDAACQLFVNWFSDTLNQRRKRVCDGVFGDGRVQPKVLRVKDFVRSKPLLLRWDKILPEGSRYSRAAEYVRFPLSDVEVSQASRYRMIRYLTWNLVMGDLSAPLFQMMQPFAPVARGEILYLPAARTGFVLMRKVLASGLLGLGGGGDALPLNLPTRRFLQRMLSLTHADKSKHGDIADLLETNLLHGTVRPDSAPLPDYQYQPSGTNGGTLPLWLTSSLVTELTPLLMFLRSKEDFRSIIIEEPEAHLHLELQSTLARILVRLVNAGLPVWITTHGDTFFQQLSNLVKSSELGAKDRNKLGIDKAEMLAIGNVSACHFKVNVSESGQRSTVIKQLRVDDSGIAAAAFNDGLTSLMTQTLALNAMREPTDES